LSGHIGYTFDILKALSPKGENYTRQDGEDAVRKSFLVIEFPAGKIPPNLPFHKGRDDNHGKIPLNPPFAKGGDLEKCGRITRLQVLSLLQNGDCPPKAD
jgi:hypothetical protein